MTTTDLHALADDIVTLRPVDPTRCDTRRKRHPVIGGRELECSECWRARIADQLAGLVAELRNQSAGHSSGRTDIHPGPPTPEYIEDRRPCDPEPTRIPTGPQDAPTWRPAEVSD